MPENLSFGQLLGLSAAGTGIGMGASLLQGSVSGLINNAFYKRNLGLQVQAQKDLIDYQNAYNAPKQQMQRLAEAGLNPNLIYGSAAPSGQSGNASAPSGVANPGSFNTPDVVNGMLRILQMKQADSQVGNIQADTRLKNAEAQSREMQNEQYPELVKLTIQQANKNIEKTASEIDLNKSSELLNIAKKALAVADEEFRRSDISLQEYRKQQMIAQTVLYGSESRLKDAQKDFTRSQDYLLDIETQMTQLDFKYKQLFYGDDGKMKQLSEAEYKRNKAIFEKDAKVAATKMGIEGNKYIQWFDWYFDHITQIGKSTGAAETIIHNP